MNITAANIMLSAVDEAKSNAQRAEQEYNRRSRELRIMTGFDIRLSSKTATNQLSDIVSAAKNACEALYASYQTQVQILDSECRPQIENDPG